MRQTVAKLRQVLSPVYGDRETESIIRLIFHHLKGWDTVGMLMHGGDTLSDFVRGEVDAITDRLLNHEPIQYIVGEARFHGLDLHVEPGVLIPRPETAELVDLVVDTVGRCPDLAVLDACTGSGCIAVALARELPFARVQALDVSPVAVRVAKDNAGRLAAKVDVLQADIFKWPGAPDSYDIVVSNPPYVDDSEKGAMEPNVLEHEPPEALFVPDDDPLVFYRRIADVAAVSLKPGGFLFFEINPRHADDFAPLLTRRGFADINVVRDSFGRLRFVTALKDK